MLRLGIFIAALIAVFIAALSLTPRLLTPNVYRAQALVGLTRALGQPVTAVEDAAIRLLPRPRLSPSRVVSLRLSFPTVCGPTSRSVTSMTWSGSS